MPTLTSPVVLRNRFQGLSINKEKELVSDDTEETPKTTPRAPVPWAQQKKSTRSTRSASAENSLGEGKGVLEALDKTIMTGTIERSYQPSYFLPGRVHRVQIQFLINTGCNTNILSKNAFDRLPLRSQRSCKFATSSDNWRMGCLSLSLG